MADVSLSWRSLFSHIFYTCTNIHFSRRGDRIIKLLVSESATEPLEDYSISERYGWTEDRYSVS